MLQQFFAWVLSDLSTAFSGLVSFVLLNIGVLLIWPSVKNRLRQRGLYFPLLLMLVSTLFCLGLIFARYQITGKTLFVFLVWNLFLAWIPLVISLLLHPARQSGVISVLLLGGWLLFLPNAPYILTDLIHLRPRYPVPVWFDLIMILTFAWTGLMLGYFSLLEVHRFLDRKIRSALVWPTMIGLLGLCSFGVYLGRFVRFNSWDILHQPINILVTSLNCLADKQAISVTGLLFIFLTLGYLCIFNLINQKRDLIAISE